MSATQDHQEDPLNASDIIRAAMMAALEEMLPGYSDCAIRHAEDDNLHREMRRLGVAAPDPRLVAEGRKALADLRATRFVVKAHLTPTKKAKAKG